MVIFLTIIFIFLLSVQYFALTRERKYLKKRVGNSLYLYKVAYNSGVSKNFKIMCKNYIDSGHLYHIEDIKKLIFNYPCDVSKYDKNIISRLELEGVDYLEF